MQKNSYEGDKMAGGYMGKILFVDLSTREIREETPSESLYKDFIGGSGLGSRILYTRQKAGVDPLGPENILGFVTGPLTGTPAVTGARYQAVAKSPLTDGWGDANSGGYFGPSLKIAGYDAVFVSGVSDKPVYLFIDNGKAEIRDAGHLWGKSTYETEDTIKAELSRDTACVCIGPAAEKLSLISCIITERGASAGRSGLGAVMGSKKLKAVAARGNRSVPLADKETAERLRREHVQELRTPRFGRVFLEFHHNYGTADQADRAAQNGDAPVKNWGGIGIIDMPDVSGLTLEKAQANVDKKYGCWHCPLACQASLKEGAAPFNYPAGTRRPEYETQEAFGSMCLNTDSESIAMANHLCNSYGVDTISAGTIISFAIECYENGIITKKDTDGIELTWGNSESIVAMTEKMVKREGFGDILADGVKVAARKMGRKAEKYAVQIGGQELGMHDPKFIMFRNSTFAAGYKMDATPGRHTAQFGPANFQTQLLNCVGLCTYCHWPVPDGNKYVREYMKAVTGWDRSMDELLECGERIVNMRHVFNLREGINPLDRKVHPRIIGKPPQKEGPLAGVTADLDAQVYWSLGAMDWDRFTTKPSKNKLLKLGLNDVAEELWPPQKPPAP
jgi:aldehyde:ferredoxin oxidoreductase